MTIIHKVTLVLTELSKPQTLRPALNGRSLALPPGELPPSRIPAYSGDVVFVCRGGVRGGAAAAPISLKNCHNDAQNGRESKVLMLSDMLTAGANSASTPDTGQAPATMERETWDVA